MYVRLSSVSDQNDFQNSTTRNHSIIWVLSPSARYATDTSRLVALECSHW